jgi:DNA-directed RNA polymerase specialized sigma24 family protein
MSASDAELVRSRDSRAFGELYARHAAAVHGWFAARVAWAAADLTAETFARAWLARRTFRDEREGSALPWLLGMGRNVLRESARHDRVETAARERLGLPLELAEDDFAGVDERLSPRPSLRAALEALPPHVAYESLPLDADAEKLLSIAAQHPGAPVVRDAAAFEAAQAELFANG